MRTLVTFLRTGNRYWIATLSIILGIMIGAIAQALFNC